VPFVFFVVKQYSLRHWAFDVRPAKFHSPPVGRRFTLDESLNCELRTANPEK